MNRQEWIKPENAWRKIGIRKYRTPRKRKKQGDRKSTVVAMIVGTQLASWMVDLRL